MPVPRLLRLWLRLRGEQGSGSEGVDDLYFHTYGEFSSPSSYSLRLGINLEAKSWVDFRPEGADFRP